MKLFEKTQKVIDIAGVKIGGQPGEWPTVMCGSIFYDRHKIVTDAKHGIFDREAAKQLLDWEKEMVDNFGLQRLPDVIGDTPEALTNYVDFVLETIDGPMLVDSSSINTLLATFKRYQGSDVMKRLVFSPIDLHTDDAQFKEIEKLGVKNALIMAFSPDAVMPDQKIQILTGSTDGVIKPDSLLAKAERAGVENLLVDVGVIDLQGTAWSALSISKVKNILGLPAGCAPANALFSWQRNHKETLTTPKQVSASGAAVYTSTVYMGADFALYGPMSCADWAYPAIAVADALMSYGNRLSGIRAKDRSHPLYKLK